MVVVVLLLSHGGPTSESGCSEVVALEIPPTERRAPKVLSSSWRLPMSYVWMRLRRFWSLLAVT